MLSSIRTVIKSKAHPSVGGSIQCGGFEGDEFYVYGIQESFKDDDGLLVMQSTYKGHTMQGQFNVLTMGKFIGKIIYLVPFLDDIGS